LSENEIKLVGMTVLNNIVFMQRTFKYIIFPKIIYIVAVYKF
jgi:hypothetical protein